MPSGGFGLASVSVQNCPFYNYLPINVFLKLKLVLQYRSPPIPLPSISYCDEQRDCVRCGTLHLLRHDITGPSVTPCMISKLSGHNCLCNNSLLQSYTPLEWAYCLNKCSECVRETILNVQGPSSHNNISIAFSCV